MYHIFLKTAARQTPAGKYPDFSKEDDIQRVEQFFKNQPKAHIRGAVTELNMSFGKIWTILREDLKFSAYRPHLAQILSPANMESHLAACNFWLQFTSDQFEKILFSDDKCPPLVVVLLRSSIASNNPGQACTVRPKCWTSSNRSSGTESSPANKSTTGLPTSQTSAPWISVSGPDHDPRVQVSALYPAGTQDCDGRLCKEL